MKTLLAIVMLTCAIASFAQDDVDKICQSATSQTLSEPKLTGPLNSAQLAKCDSESLYYGFGSKPDYAAALQCAWYERAHPDPVHASMSYGVGVLTMLYANGRGVAKSIDLATRLACEQTWAAPAERSGRVRHLNELRAAKPPDMPFDMCDDITSGLSMGLCAAVQQQFADAEREKKLAAISAKFTAEQRRLYEKLRLAENKFNDLRTGEEIDLSGTARAAFSLADLGKLRDQFLINLERFGKNDIPPATASDVKNLDAEMNALYQRIMQALPATFELGTVKPEGIRDTQRAWLKVRDAWMDFARAAYPRLGPDRVMAQLLRLRLNQLRLLPIDLK